MYWGNFETNHYRKLNQRTSRMSAHEKLQKVGEEQLVKYAKQLIEALKQQASPEIITGYVFQIDQATKLAFPYEYAFHEIPHNHSISAYRNSRCTKCGVRVPKISGLTLTNYGCLCVKCLSEIN